MRSIIGVMGAGESASQRDCEAAHALGCAIAKHGWILLCGRRNAGVMAAVCRGAREHQGITVGILPGEDRKGMSDDVMIPIVTGMGSARNNINVLSSDLVVVLGHEPGAGTISEAALAVKAGKPVYVLGSNQKLVDLLQSKVKAFGELDDLIEAIKQSL